MNDIALSSLRVAADIDASKYKTGADQKVASDRAMVASAQAVGSALSQTDTKISTAGDSLAKLSRQYLDGYKNQERFEQGLRQIGRQLDSGKTDIDGATRLLVGMNQKLGLSADVSEVAAKGQVQLAAAVAAANVQIEGQATVLAQTAAAHAMMIAQARADQAAENQRQSAAANQNSFNGVLGVTSAPAASARASASAFEADFAKMEVIATQKAQQIGQTFGADLDQSLIAGTTKSARDAAATFSAELDRIDQVAALKAQQIGATFQSDLNASFGIGSSAGNSARASASVFEEVGREADQMAAKVTALRAELNPLAAAQDKLNAELAEYSALAAKGAISAEELAQAQALVNNRYGAQNGVITAGTNALRLNRIGMMELQASGVNAFQALASGMSVLRVAEMEGAQVVGAFAQGTEGGITGTLTAIKAGAVAAGTAFVGVVGTVGAVATGLGVAALAAGAFYLATREKTKDVNKLLSEQKTIIESLGPAYAEVARQRDAQSPGQYESIGVGRLVLQKNLEDAQKAAQEQAKAALKEMQGSGGSFLGLVGALPEGVQSALGRNQSSIEFDHIVTAAQKGEMSINDARTALQRFGELHPEFSYTIGRFIEMSEAAAKTERDVGGLADTLDRLGRTLRPENGVLPKGSAPGGPLDATTDIAQYRMQQQFRADMLGVNARSPQELAAAARAQTALNPSGSAAEQATRVELAGKKALIEAEHQLKEAQDQRLRSLDATLASAKLDVDLVGKTTTQVEGLRMAAQLEAQVREEAARNHVAADEAEIARIKEKAAEYGKLRALQEARDTIHGQEIDLETQRAEVATVGENTLARNRAAAALKTEQDIRKLGIPLYGQEANAMRANTAALSDQAAALAKASLQADLLFERSQILRNSDDQAIASRLQSAGLPIDLNSQEAQMMRYNMALQETKDTFKGFATDMLSGLKEGKSLWESFGDAAKNALAKIADKLIDRGLDGIFNSLFGGQAGSQGASPSSGGLLGWLGNLFNGGASQQQQQGSTGGSSILSKLFGGAGGQSVGSMQVQAAVVNVNGGVGGVGGGLSDILSKLGSPSFKADTTLSDILGYGGGADNQNMIQSRIDQAFGTGGSAQDMIQSRIDQAFGTSGGLGGIFSPSGGFASSTGGAASAMSLGGGSVTDMIRRAAAAEGINPDVFLQVAKSEGGLSGFTQSNVFKNGIQEPSFGPMQLLKGGPGTGFPRGLGNAFQEQTGLDPANPANMEAGINFAAQQAKQSGWSQWYGAKAAGISKWEGINRGSDGIDPMTTKSIAKLGDASSKASGALGNLGGASDNLISQFSKMGQSLLSQLTPATSSSSWFQGLSSMFGGSAGALGYMNSISPAATSDILSGSWGLFDDGGFTGRGGRKEAAGIVHRGEVVWSQDDIARAGGVHVVEGMRRGFGGYADGGIVRSRMRYDGTSSPRQSSTPSAANDRPTQNIHQTINYNLNERPMTPASQNQNAAKNARALERLTRTQ